jgi:hypothetical protein
MGSHSRLSKDGGQTWGEITSTPVSAPHGPLRRRDGSLLYLGKPDYPCRYPDDDTRPKAISAFRSDDDGQSWQRLGQVPPPEGAAHHNCHEPHVVELPSGKLLGMCRFETCGRDTEEARTRWSSQTFGLAQTQSLDGGQNWSPFRLLQVLGSPPHLLLHSSGALVCTYGHRRVPYGQRAIISRDEGATWSRPVGLRDDGFSVDLGYPASVELPDGNIFSVYYQAAGADEKPGILWTKWSLPV